MNYTIRTNGGNHGHQLKDWMGAYTIGVLLGLEYYHTNYEYLNFFLPSDYFKKNISTLKKENNIYIKGPLWQGITDYNEFKKKFNKIKKDPQSLYIFKKSIRVHPFQTIDWFNKKYIKKNVFEEVCNDVTKAFYSNKEKKQTNSDVLNVCVHVNLYENTGKSPNQPRFRFPVEYYLRIIEQLETTYKKQLSFNIYAEKTNSDIVKKAFSDKKFKLHIGEDRDFYRSIKNFETIHSIFKDFVDADILVCSNSSFSVVASYFRVLDKNKITIYHPHTNLSNLNDYKNCIATDTTGVFKK